MTFPASPESAFQFGTKIGVRSCEVRLRLRPTLDLNFRLTIMSTCASCRDCIRARAAKQRSNRPRRDPRGCSAGDRRLRHGHVDVGERRRAEVIHHRERGGALVGEIVERADADLRWPARPGLALAHVGAGGAARSSTMLGPRRRSAPTARDAAGVGGSRRRRSGWEHARRPPALPFTPINCTTWSGATFEYAITRPVEAISATFFGDTRTNAVGAYSVT